MEIALSSSSFKELKSLIPLFAELLGCQQNEVVILNRCLSDYHKKNSLADKIVGERPLFGVPLRNYKLHYGNNDFSIDGIKIYETIDGIRYLLYSSRNVKEESICRIIVKKGNLFRLQRHVNRQNKKYYTTKDGSPILEKEFLDDVVNSTIGFFRKRKMLQHYKVNVKRGIMLTGSPGNGKTMLCRYLRALASAHSVAVSTLTTTDIEDGIKYGTLPNKLNQDGILFIDDIDISYFDASRADRGVCPLLSAMDGLENNGNTVRVFTTNEETDNMDPAFLRPGRIDKVFEFKLPTLDLRRRFINTWHEDIIDYLKKEELFYWLADKTEGMSFAQVNLIKTIMVEHFIDEQCWDAQRALKLTEERLDSAKEAKGLGLNAVSKEHRKAHIRELTPRTGPKI